MPCNASHPGCCRHDLDSELALPRARLAHEDYALVPLSHSHHAHSDRPLSHYIADDSALDPHYSHRRRPIHRCYPDDASIAQSPYIPRCRNPGSPHNDAECLELPDPNWRFSYSYPLQGMEPGGVRWSPGQIHAYNRDVIRHNNQIARRRAAGVPGEYMKLHPMMDSLGRFPPGFDRPLSLQEFFGMDGKQDSHLFSLLKQQSHRVSMRIMTHPFLSHLLLYLMLQCTATHFGDPILFFLFMPLINLSLLKTCLDDFGQNSH